MNIHKGERTNRRKIARHYRRSIFVVVAITGLLGGLVAQTAGNILTQHNAFAAAGWNWVSQEGADGFDDGYMASTNPTVSADGVHVMWPRQNGLYISSDNGASFTPHFPDGQANTYYGGVGISDNGSYMVAMDEESDAVYRSANSGATWQKLTDLDDSEYYLSGAPALISNDGQTIVRGIYYSSDGGTTWLESDNYIDRISSNGQVFFAINQDPDTNGALISTDSGQTWHASAPLPGGIPNGWSPEIDMSSDGARIVAYLSYTDVDETVNYVAVSYDQGDSWDSINGTADGYNITSMSRDGTALIGTASASDGTELVRSLDYGVTWQPSGAYTFPGGTSFDYNLVVSQNGQHLAYNDYWVYFASDDGGVTWRAAINPKGVQSIMVSSDGSTLYGMTGRGSSFAGEPFPVKSSDNGITWTPTWTSVFETCASVYWWNRYWYGDTDLIQPGNEAFIMLKCTDFDGNTKSLISNDNGNTWFFGSDTIENTAWEKASNNGQHVVAIGSANAVYVSNDRGVTWTTHTSSVSLSHIRSVSNDGQKILAVPDTGYDQYLSLDGGQTWMRLDDRIKQAFPDYDDTDYQSVSALSGDGSTFVVINVTSSSYPHVGYVYRSTDDGNTWQRTTVSLGVRSEVTISNDGKKIAYIDDTNHLITSVDGGVTFESQDNYEGMTTWLIVDPAISADGSTLLAFDHEGYLAVAKYGFTPKSVQNTVATPDYGAVTVTWNPATLIDTTDTLDAYEVQYRTAPNGSWVSASQSVSPSATSYKVLNLTAGQRYDFRVRAHSILGGWTNWARALAPVTKISLSAESAPDNSIDTSMRNIAANDKGDIVFLKYDTDGAYTLEQSTDNGLTWEHNTMSGLSSEVRTGEATAGSLKISADGQKIGMIIGNNFIISGDGGVTWRYDTLFTAGQNRDTSIFDMSDDGQQMIAYHAYASGGGEEYFTSSDGGNTWTPLTNFPDQSWSEYSYPLNLIILNDGTVFASDYWQIWKTSESGANWEDITETIAGGKYSQISAPDTHHEETNGKVLVFVSDDLQTMVSQVNMLDGGTPSYFVTKDGGQSWATYTITEDVATVGEEFLTSTGDNNFWSFFGEGAAYTPSGNLAYLTGLDEGTNYGINIVRSSVATAIPLAAILSEDPGDTPSDVDNPSNGTSGSGQVNTSPSRNTPTNTPAGDVAANQDSQNNSDIDTTHKDNGADSEIIPGAPETGAPWWKDWVVVSWILAIIAALIAIIIWTTIARARRKKRQESGFNSQNF